MTQRLLWFRLDLRLTDNPALLAAVHRGGPVIPVFIWAPDEEGPWQPGAASRWWLHQSLTRLDASLRRARLSPDRPTRPDACRRSAHCWSNRLPPPCSGTAATSRPSSTETRRVKAALQKDGRIVESFNGSLLFEPWTVRTQQGQPYQVFTPFWKACLAQPGTLRRRSHPPLGSRIRVAGRPRSSWPNWGSSQPSIGPAVFVRAGVRAKRGPRNR